MIIYYEVIDFTDLDVVDHFMELAEKDSVAALAYLGQWDYGDNMSDLPLTRQQIFEGLSFTKYVEDGEYLALWQIGINGITLYRKAEKDLSNPEADNNAVHLS